MGTVKYINLESRKNLDNTLRSYRIVLNSEDITKISETIFSKYPIDNYALYLYVHGGKTKEYFLNLENNKRNFEIVWRGKKRISINSFGSFFIYLLNTFFASYFSLIKVYNPNNIHFLFNDLATSTMVSVISFSKTEVNAFESNFISNAKNISFSPEDYISNFPSFFHLTIDGGTLDDDTNGYLSKCEYGKDCADVLLNIIEYTGKRW